MKEFYRKYLCLFAALLPFSAAAQGISPTNLQCEAKSNPIGLSETSPRLSWQDVATVSGARGQYLASNVAALKFDFTSPASENGYCGYCGYAAITIPPYGFITNVTNLVVGRTYTLQSTTNLARGVWTNETNFVATQSMVAITNSAANSAEKCYRVVGN